MSRKVIKVSHIFLDSHCCVCSQEGLGQYSNLRENFINVRGDLISYMTILESTLNCQNLIGDDLELCEPCKNTIIPFYLLKLKLDEANQLPETRKKYREQSIDLLATNETDQISFVKLEAMEDVSCEESVDGWQETSFAEPKKKKSRPNQYDWVEKKVFQNSDEATEFIKAQKIWSVKNTKPPCKNGEKRQYYRCNQVPRSQSHQCPCVATLVTKSDGSIVFLQTTEAHDHSQINSLLQTHQRDSTSHNRKSNESENVKSENPVFRFFDTVEGQTKLRCKKCQAMITAHSGTLKRHFECKNHDEERDKLKFFERERNAC